MCHVTPLGLRSFQCVVLSQDEDVDLEGDLNKVSEVLSDCCRWCMHAHTGCLCLQEELKLAKQMMEVEFKKNALLPGDEG